jgi:hypothetical protein
MRAPKPVVPGTLILVEVSRLPGRTRTPEVLWLWWHEQGAPDLALIWRAYVRGFDLERTFRFDKQVLNWTTPHVRHPEQADRWTWLVVIACTQVRLARSVVCDQRLPWERPPPLDGMTLYRARRALSRVQAALGTPASSPKTLWALAWAAQGTALRPCTTRSCPQEDRRNPSAPLSLQLPGSATTAGRTAVVK